MQKHQINIFEKRMIFFENTSLKEKLSESLETQKENSNFEKDFESVAKTSNKVDEIAEQEGTRAEKAKLQVQELLLSPDISEKAKEVLRSKKDLVDSATASGKHETIAAAVTSLEKSVKFQQERMEKNLKDTEEFSRLNKLPGAEFLFKDLKNLPRHIGEFKLKTSKEKQKILEDMRKQLENKNNPANQKAVESLLKKFANDPSVPKGWQQWAENPEKYGRDEKEQDPAYVAKWISENIGEMRLSTLKYESFLSANSHVFEKAGMSPHSREEYQKLGRKERNGYLEFLRNRVAKIDKEDAKRLEGLKTSEGAETQAIQEKNDEASADKERKLNEKCDEIVNSIKHSTLRAKLEEKIKDRQIEDQKENATKKSKSTASKRERIANGGTINPIQETWEKTKEFGADLKNKLSITLGLKTKEELSQEEEEKSYNNATEKVAEEMTEESREQEGLSRADKLELDSILDFKEKPEQNEWATFLKFVMVKEVSRENLKAKIKEDPSLFRRKTKIGKSI